MLGVYLEPHSVLDVIKEKRVTTLHRETPLPVERLYPPYEGEGWAEGEWVGCEPLEGAGVASRGFG